MIYEPTSFEIEVLRMLAGEREGEWGAWVGACLEFLEDAGLCTRGPNYQITEAGREVKSCERNRPVMDVRLGSLARRVARLEDDNKKMRDVLEWLNWRGGLGYDAHDRIAVALNKAPKNGTQ